MIPWLKVGIALAEDPSSIPNTHSCLWLQLQGDLHLFLTPVAPVHTGTYLLLTHRYTCICIIINEINIYLFILYEPA